MFSRCNALGRNVCRRGRSVAISFLDPVRRNVVSSMRERSAAAACDGNARVRIIHGHDKTTSPGNPSERWPPPETKSRPCLSDVKLVFKFQIPKSAPPRVDERTRKLRGLSGTADGRRIRNQSIPPGTRYVKTEKRNAACGIVRRPVFGRTRLIDSSRGRTRLLDSSRGRTRLLESSRGRSSFGGTTSLKADRPRDATTSR